MKGTKVLLRTDKNGTKYWEETYACPSCNGTGYIDYYKYHDNGVCYDCNGTGVKTERYKEYTPEYEARLNAKRLERATKKNAEKKANWFTDNGFNAEGVTYLFLGDTYSIKDTLKELGAKFDARLGWHIDHKVEGYNFLQINLADVAEETFNGYDITTTRAEFDTMKRKAYNALSASSYVGEVGKRINVSVTFDKLTWFDKQTPWGKQTTWIHRFTDENGNVLVWKSTALICNSDGSHINTGTQLNLIGTVKEHSEYLNEKQTLLTRCRVA